MENNVKFRAIHRIAAAFRTLKAVGIIALIAVIGLTAAACGGAKHQSVESITKFLAKQSGTTAEKPAKLSVQMELGNMESSGSAWGQIMEALKNWGGYVSLDVSASTMSGTVFNPGRAYEKIASIVLPDTTTEIGRNVLNSMASSCAINVTNKNAAYSSTDGILYSKDGKTLLHSTNRKGTVTVVVPNGVTRIGDSSFSGFGNLVSITLPDSVTSIGGGAFALCEALASITIPDGVVSIEGGTFSMCGALASVTIPNSVKSIGNQAFDGCKALTSITIPSSVASIGNSAFRNCNALTSVTIQGNIPSSSFNTSAFGDAPSRGGIYLGGYIGNLREAYLAANGGPGTYERISGHNVWLKQ